MNQFDQETDSPGLNRLTRRQFVKLLTLGCGAALLPRFSNSFCQAAPQTVNRLHETPVRNPAFQAIPGAQKGHTVLYCQVDLHHYLAFDLNAAGYRIWGECLSHSDRIRGLAKPVSVIAANLRNQMNVTEINNYLSRLEANGIIYWADQASKTYFAFEEAH